MKGFFLFWVLLVYSSAIDSAEVLRLSGIVLPNVELNQLGNSTFQIQTNSQEKFRYEISNKIDFKLERKRELLQVKKAKNKVSNKPVYLTVIAK